MISLSSFSSGSHHVEISFDFAPSTNVVKVPHAHDSAITILATNVEFFDDILKLFANSGIEDLFDYVKFVLLDMHFVTSQTHSILNKSVSSTIHALLILMLKKLWEPLEMVNIGSLLMWKPLKLLFIFLDLKFTLKLPRKKFASPFVEIRV